MINKEQVLHLREITGAGTMDCKKALEACSGDEEAAIEWLKRPRRIIFGKLPSSRAENCIYCKKKVCENTYDEESETCRNCFSRKCMRNNNE